MQINIPPIVFYVLGAVLVFFGALRVKYLAAPRPPEPTEQEEIGDPKPVRGKTQRRHFRMGILWILMGLFLVVSTYWQARKQG